MTLYLAHGRSCRRWHSQPIRNLVCKAFAVIIIVGCIYYPHYIANTYTRYTRPIQHNCRHNLCSCRFFSSPGWEWPDVCDEKSTRRNVILAWFTKWYCASAPFFGQAHIIIWICVSVIPLQIKWMGYSNARMVVAWVRKDERGGKRSSMQSSSFINDCTHGDQWWCGANLCYQISLPLMGAHKATKRSRDEAMWMVSG